MNISNPTMAAIIQPNGESAVELAQQWVAGELAKRSQATDLIRTRGAIAQSRIVATVAARDDDFAAHFYTAVEDILLKRDAQGMKVAHGILKEDK